MGWAERRTAARADEELGSNFWVGLLASAYDVSVTTPKFDLADVSEDRITAEVWSYTPEFMRREVKRLGFSLLGFSHFRQDRAQLVREAYVSEDQHTQAVLFGPDVNMELVSLFADGSIIVTSLQADALTQLLMTQLVKTHPADRYEVELVTGSVEDAVQRHRARLAAHPLAPVVVTVDGIRVHLATRFRLFQLLVSRQHAQQFITLTIGLSTMILVGTFLMRTAGQDIPPTAVLLGTIGGLIAGYLSVQLSLRFIAPLLTRLRPGPAALPAATMIANAEALPRRLLLTPHR